jgi:signal transduction histidine kinase
MGDPVDQSQANAGYHKTLARQIGKYFGNAFTPETNLAQLLQAVSDTYTHADEDHALVERSLEISSRELTENYQHVKKQVEDKTRELSQRTQEAENSRATLQAVLDNLPLGVIVVQAPSGIPTMMNKTGEAMMGVSLKDQAQSTDLAHYNTVVSILRDDGSEYPIAELPLTKTMLSGKPFTADNISIRRPDGTLVGLRIFTAPILRSDGTFNSAVSVFEDVSEQRNLQRTRDEFFAIASHELRTPLTAIRGNSSLILKYYLDKLTDPELRDIMKEIHESSIRLIDIVNDFLDASSLEQKRMKFTYTSFDVVELAASVCKEYEANSVAQGVTLNLLKPSVPLPPAYADRDRLKQVLINLAGNALKFTKQGSVKLEFASEPNSIKVIISDTGNGMSEESKKMLFRKFEQAGMDPITRDSTRGTGLGLYISKLLMEYMNGEIRLESSELGKGTSFSLRIPIAAAQSH